MKTDGGYDEMLKMMADFVSVYRAAALKKRKAGERHQLPTDGVFSDIIHGFAEIGSALETLTLTEELLRLAPPRSKRVDKDCYLKFLVGSYLQEMYILEQRLTAYAKKLSRLYHSPSLPDMVRPVVYEPLEGLIKTRGTHVHQRRFSDERMDYVSSLAFCRLVGLEFGEDLEFEYKLTQLEWSKRVRENNRETRRIVNQYCALLEIVICKDGKVTMP